MSTIRTKGINEQGVEFTQVEELTIYTVNSKEDQEKIVSKLNNQIKSSLEERKISLSLEDEEKFLFSIEENLMIDYPYVRVIDCMEMMYLTDLIIDVCQKKAEINKLTSFKI